MLNTARTEKVLSTVQYMSIYSKCTAGGLKTMAPPLVLGH